MCAFCVGFEIVAQMIRWLFWRLWTGCGLGGCCDLVDGESAVRVLSWSGFDV